MDANAMPVRGEILTPEHPGYDDARRIFNDRVMGRPAVIVRCAGVSDVCAALRLARDERLAVSVRGGGHGLAGWASNDGGMVIDLTRLRWVLVDTSTSTAWVGGGVRAIDVVSETVKHGLVPVTGVTSTVGLGGLATGAGEGYLTPQYGFASDNVLAFELVTAAGDVIRVSATEQPDLFWAMRGAGPNFGVVTAMQLRLHPLPTHVVGGILTFAGDDVARVTRSAWEVLETGSRHLFPQVLYSSDPDHGLTVQILPGFVGPRDLAERELDRLRRCGRLIDDDTAPTTYEGLLRQIPGEFGGRHLWDIRHFPFSGSREDQIALVVETAVQTRPGPWMELWRTLPPRPDGPLSVLPRDPGVAVVLASIWSDDADDARQREGFEEVTAAFQNSGLVGESPSMSNHVSSYDLARVKAVYGTDAFDKLARLKSIYDADNLFRRNLNVPPKEK